MMERRRYMEQVHTQDQCTKGAICSTGIWSSGDISPRLMDIDEATIGI